MMINQRNFRISLATLILCFCLGSLAILPFIQVGLFVPEIFEVDAENYNLFEHAEFDGDFIVVSTNGAEIADLNFSKYRPMNLDFQSAYLSPGSPPPKKS
ncbi:MAG: hypothetical protein NTW69_04935 [Chloroflexi bacterium]|nr:hypothetical protein [Chloroflexota bacterium]